MKIAVKCTLIGIAVYRKGIIIVYNENLKSKYKAGVPQETDIDDLEIRLMRDDKNRISHL